MPSLITTDRTVLAAIAAVVDVAEGYVPKRAPDYVTERHADIVTHPDGKSYAYPDDATVRKRMTVVTDALAKYSVTKTAITDKWQPVIDGKTATADLALGGDKTGVTLTWTEKDVTWTPKDEISAGAEGEMISSPPF